MAKKKIKKVKDNSDGAYFLRLVMLLILGCFWVKLGSADSWQIPIPVGLIVGVLLVRNERLKIDRKIQYGVLLVAMLVGFWMPIGLFINV